MLNRTCFRIRFPFENRLLSEKTKNSLLKTKSLFIILFLLITGFRLAAQAPNADFSASKTEGCAPLSVKFTDLSTNNPTEWFWEFGTDQFSTLQNPSITFSTPGKWKVRLVVKNSSGINELIREEYITVYPSARVNFSASSNVACTPATIQFTDLTTVNGGTVTSWLWDFGDGTTSTQKNPRHVFTNIGYYNVSLRVKTANGCEVEVAKNRFIRVIGGVTPNFDFSRSGSCSAPVDVNFINQTTGPGDLTYRWTLGNGNTSTDKNPSTTYTTLGTFNVKLVATSSYGCRDSISRPITFSSNNTSFNAPDSVCPGKAITFTNNGNPVPTNASWDFGDGTTSKDLNPVKSYTNPGTYTVTLVNKYAECSGTFTKTIKVTSPPVVNFTSANALGCKAPYEVKFQDLTANASNWSWDFGDGGTSTEKNPSHTYQAPGNYSVTLTIKTTDGCPGSITKTSIVKIQEPGELSINGLPQSGCSPQTINPSVSYTSIDGIASYEWDFGIPGATSTSATPTYTYSTVGNYTVKLKVTTNTGCIDTLTLVNAVNVGTKPVVDFTVDNDTTCAGTEVTFTSNSSPATNWQWDFGDGGSSSEENPKYKFQDTGLMTITLTVSNNGCTEKLVKTDYVYTIAPVALFTPEFDCNNRLRVSFLNNSITDPTHGATSYLWDFGNGQTSTTESPTITYAAYGTYTVTLTATDGVCSYTRSQTLNLFELINNFSINKPNICRNEIFTLSASGTSQANIRSYTWQINGGAPFQGGRTLDTSLAVNGKYDVSLTMEDINGCTITTTIPDIINIVGSEADFTVVNNGGCANSEISITDQSSPAGTITQWTFNFGDGTNKTFNAPPFTHIYSGPGVFDIKLRARDNFGCIDTITRVGIATITSPVANFGAEDTLFCPGIGLQFRDSSAGNNLTYVWDFGDGGSSTQQEPVHAYSGPDSVYTVKLIVKDAFGCTDSLIRTNYIRIMAPVAEFSLLDSSAICPPLETRFISGARNYESLYWEFGDGNTSTLPNTNYFYNTYGKYTVRLHTIGYGGCRDTATAEVNVYNPFSALFFEYSPNEECNEIKVNFTVVPPPNTKFYLVFDDGAVDSSQATNITHLYNRPNVYRPWVKLVDSLECEVAIGNRPVIRVKGVLPLFDMSQRRFCDTGTVAMKDFSIGNDPVSTRSWDFGDGSPGSTEKNPSHYFNIPGTYIVTQHVTTVTGCENSYSDTVRVFRTPIPVITGPDEICLNELMTQNGSTVVPDSLTIWNWNYGNGQTSTEKDATIRYTSAGQATIQLTTSNLIGCSADTSKLVDIWPLPVIENVPEVIIPVGFGTTLPVTYSNNVTTWVWTPSTALSCTDCPTPFANPKFTTNYRVAVTDSNGCRATSHIIVRVICENRNYFVPNTFSPNNDGQNDIFYPRGKGIDRIQSMRIYNRWGELVFERKNFPVNSQVDGWNGMIRGKQAESDAYVYIIEVICDNAQIIPLKGNVTLIR